MSSNSPTLLNYESSLCAASVVAAADVVNRISMDPLSVAASVAGVAAMGAQLSQTIYNLIPTVLEAEKEMSSVANDLSLLTLVFNELEEVLRQDSRVYRRRMVRAVNEILKNCEGVFEGISKYVFVNPQDTRSSKQFQKNVCWPNVRTVFTHADVEKEKFILVEVLLDNRQSILSLKQIEKDRDRGQNPRNISEDKRPIEGTDSVLALDDGAPNIERTLGLTRLTDSGSSANTSFNTGLFSKAAKDSVTDTTYNSTWSSDGNTRHKKTSTGFDYGNFGPRNEGNGEDKAEEINTGGEDGWGPCTRTTTQKKHKKNRKDLPDGISNFPNPTVVKTTFGNSEATADDSWSAWGVASSKDKEGKQMKKRKEQKRKESDDNNQRSQHGLRDPSVPARSVSHSEHSVEFIEVSEAGSSGSRQRLYCGDTEKARNNGAGDLPSPSESQENPASKSPASEYYSIPPEFPITDNIEPHYFEEGLAMKPRRAQSTVSAERLATKFSKNQGSPTEMEKLTPSAQWFLSVVPHESSDSALVLESRSGDANHFRARAEETTKKLLLDWTNVDPDVISGEEELGGWNACRSSNSYPPGRARDKQASNQSYGTSYTPQAYPMYAPQQWYPPAVVTPPLLPPPVITPPPPPNDNQTDSEELARLKKLILDEKAEQDVRAAAVAAAAAPIAPSRTVELPEDNTQHESTYMEAADPVRISQEHNALWKAEPTRLQPVIMRDWLGRKFIFPVDMCQTWEALHGLILEAFGHMLEYRPMIEKGKYLISHVTGEVILPSTWELFVQPGLEINMEISNVFDAFRDESSGKAVMAAKRDQGGPKTLIPPQASEVPTPGSPMALRSRKDDEPSIDDIPDDETDCSSPNGISYTERSDPRFLSIENVLLEQKKAKVEAEMKLERNRRFFQLKQQLIDQGAAIQARQDAAEHAEQDSKLAWLEKQVREQKEELDRLPALLTTPPSSTAGESLSKSASRPPRKPSLGARLLGRIPSRSIRSRGSVRSQQTTTEG